MAAKQGGKRGLIYLSKLKNMFAVTAEEAAAPLRTGFLIEKHLYDPSGVPKAPGEVQKAFPEPVDKIEDARLADAQNTYPDQVKWGSHKDRLERLSTIPQLPDDFDFSQYDTIRAEDVPKGPGKRPPRMYLAPPRTGYSDDPSLFAPQEVTDQMIREQGRFPQKKSIHANKQIE